MNSILKLFCVAVLLIAAYTATAQILEPKIKFTLRFEDAIGNKDSVIVGYDSLAAPYIDLDFGEVDLTEVPFDSIFEVRGADMGGQEDLSKITIDAWWDAMCEWEGFAQYQSINIFAKHFPVRISWDSTYFAQECYDWTHFTRSWYYLFHPSFYNGNIIRLNEQSDFVVTKEYLAQTETFRTSYLHSVEGGIEDTVYVMFIGLAGSQPTDAVEEPFGAKASVVPNPATYEVRLELPESFGEAVYWQVFDASGQVNRSGEVEHVSQSSWRIEVMDWPPGVYTVKTVNDKGKFATARFVKL